MPLQNQLPLNSLGPLISLTLFSNTILLLLVHFYWTRIKISSKKRDGANINNMSIRNSPSFKLQHNQPDLMLQNSCQRIETGKTMSE